MSAKAFGLLIGAVTLVVTSVAPASAEFFGCNEPRTKVSYSNASYRSSFAQAPARTQRYTSQPSQRRVTSQSRFQWH
jgi:hypothetical protein